MFELGNTRKSPLFPITCFNLGITEMHLTPIPMVCHVMSDMSTLFVVMGPRNLTCISPQYNNREHEKERKENYEVKISAQKEIYMHGK